MTFAELQRLVRSITFCGGLSLLKPSLRVYDEHREPGGLPHFVPDAPEDCVGVGVFLANFPDRETGEPPGDDIETYSIARFSLATVTAAEIAEGIRAGVMSILDHEVRESILCGGVRLLDPHRVEARR